VCGQEGVPQEIGIAVFPKIDRIVVVGPSLAEIAIEVVESVVVGSLAR
jgi:hypothetical protein